ncbi:hypothetical protein COT77_01180 [Candidatus Berkelbacteria bacterium CG10_big_fil_rev_8_21_14_0_10_41_12]|uniref:Uncharacterized protein n=1 Tax=Candidatus Berkelbacteria bacterium CG10_big_fil_rev_8_21_14_0_10_41_12 TaxID=1974513 RepID=A0A2M6WXG2_9BACT|nr:MAG: hypothetical protein COT77_01180 [Candidatus Berkelbacteria bacterium CG10_big_fil_rev_8_21_14_0_10_41_12]
MLVSRKINWRSHDKARRSQQQREQGRERRRAADNVHPVSFAPPAGSKQVRKARRREWDKEQRKRLGVVPKLPEEPATYWQRQLTMSQGAITRKGSDLRTIRALQSYSGLEGICLYN